LIKRRNLKRLTENLAIKGQLNEKFLIKACFSDTFNRLELVADVAKKTLTLLYISNRKIIALQHYTNSSRKCL
jgi:hypothetical protein